MIVPGRMSSCAKACIVAMVASSPYGQYYTAGRPWQWLRSARCPIRETTPNRLWHALDTEPLFQRMSPEVLTAILHRRSTWVSGSGSRSCTATTCTVISSGSIISKFPRTLTHPEHARETELGIERRAAADKRRTDTAGAAPLACHVRPRCRREVHA